MIRSLLFLLLFVPESILAQDHHFMIFFKDKAGSNYSLENPGEFLSERALNRREKQNIAITNQDLPVSPVYLEMLAENNVQVLHTTRWFNGAMVVTDSATVNQLVSQPEFTHYQLAKTGGTAAGKSGRKGTQFYDAEKLKKATSLRLQALNQSAMLGIDAMHQQQYNGEGMFIAVFDGGFNGADQAPFFKHIFNNNKMHPGYDYVGQSEEVFKYGDHGTMALSCIGALLDSTLAGGSYGADFMLCITEEGSRENRFEEYNWLLAAERADSAGVDIISTSLGYTTFDVPEMNYTRQDLDGETTVITRAVNAATSKGIICVNSAGNEGRGSWGKISAPADAPNSLTVGAIRMDGSKAGFSSVGPTADGRLKPDVVALGVNTVVGNQKGSLEYANGTSFAAPLIAGLVGGIWQANPDLTNLQTIDLVKRSASNALSPNNDIGYGIPSFKNLDNVVLNIEQEQGITSYFSVYPNPLSGGELKIETDKIAPNQLLSITLVNSAGKTVLQEQKKVEGELLGLKIGNVQKGIYILQLRSQETNNTIKIIKF